MCVVNSSGTFMLFHIHINQFWPGVKHLVSILSVIQTKTIAFYCRLLCGRTTQRHPDLRTIRFRIIAWLDVTFIFSELFPFICTSNTAQWNLIHLTNSTIYKIRNFQKIAKKKQTFPSKYYFYAITKGSSSHDEDIG